MDAVTAAAVIVPVSAGVAIAAVVPVWGGPPGTTGLVALLAFALALMAGIAASGPVGERVTRSPAREEEAPTVVRQQGPATPDEPEWRDRGRCLGCVQVAEVAEAGVLARGGVEVPLYVCSSCLEHLEAWHAAQLAVIGADLGAALAERFGVPFHFGSPEVPDDSAPRWQELR
ncbi:hypothetical protein OG689_27940 [Kitasatospora sp. NBC_00240]|uniref:hypothetical protein n=1 Tax=Kitasatospora sp. NBC_00240 TaxID=2903567 RepID=UPI0022590E7F|nr:hypothetical protein [Kitasatospora sp. NBC_00240]MCX5213057.1 hypothetical protein [Kitasatospora sp. NBC_00240]